MRPLALVGAVVYSSVVALAQMRDRTYGLDDRVFDDCDTVLSRALELTADIRGSEFVAELYPKTKGSQVEDFLSETTAEMAARWIASHDTKNIPDALFYFVKGAYTLRCRDNSGRYVKLSGPFGRSSPLDLNLSWGSAEIWYFQVTSNYHNAFVYMVSDVSLQSLNASEETALIAQMKDLLSARFVQSVGLRNDPWFLGSGPNSQMYFFTDSYKPISLQEYRATRTLNCNENLGCAFRLTN